MTRLLVYWALVNLAASLWTGAQRGVFFTDMTGFFPPHYGYTMYAVSVLPLLAPWRGARWLAWTALLASRNRASQVGVLAGWAWAGGRRRLALAGILVGLAAFGGALLKPYARNDSDRVGIWKATLQTVVAHPEGVGTGQLYMGVNGRAFNKAHSDVLHLAAEQGVKVAALVLLVLGWAFYRLPQGTPEKAAVAALLSQSIIDNRLHHPACLGLLVAAFIAATFAKTPAGSR